jgi:hypothetical protein
METRYLTISNGGDGDTTTWTEFRPSGPPGYSESHSWNTQGTYIIQAMFQFLVLYAAEQHSLFLCPLFL